MQMIYTKQEIQAMSVEELQDLMYFGNDSISIPFSEIASFYDTHEASGVRLKNGKTLNAESDEAFRRLLAKRTRYELLMGTLSGLEHEVNAKVEFMNEISKLVAEQVESLRANYLQNTQTMTNTIGTIKDTANQVLGELTSEVLDVSKTCKKKLDVFEDFNSNTYEIKMRKVDKIIDAFKELLD